MKAHWTPSDFVVVNSIPAYDGTDTTNDYGYCRKCGADMQRFGHDGKPGPLRHYNSHRYSKQRITLTLREAQRA